MSLLQILRKTERDQKRRWQECKQQLGATHPIWPLGRIPHHHRLPRGAESAKEVNGAKALPGAPVSDPVGLCPP